MLNSRCVIVELLLIKYDELTHLSFLVIWDKIVFLASLWCSANGVFSVVLLIDA